MLHYAFMLGGGRSGGGRSSGSESAPAPYLEGRITGTCDAQYSCTAMYEICRVARAFDPNFASVHLTPAFDSLRRRAYSISSTRMNSYSSQYRYPARYKQQG